MEWKTSSNLWYRVGYYLSEKKKETAEPPRKEKGRSTKREKEGGKSGGVTPIEKAGAFSWHCNNRPKKGGEPKGIDFIWERKHRERREEGRKQEGGSRGVLGICG